MTRHAALVLILVTLGCSDRSSATATNQVSLAELERATKHLTFFNYRGSDPEFHHFATSEGRQYKVKKEEWQVPVPFPVGGGAELFVTVKDGKIAVPDPEKMRKLVGEP